MSAGTALENSISECDLQVPSISDYSIELTKMGHSNSNYSVQSLKSVTSLESHAEDDVTEFMHRFVDILFSDSSQLTQELKSEFGSKSQVRSTGSFGCVFRKIFHFFIAFSARTDRKRAILVCPVCKRTTNTLEACHRDIVLFADPAFCYNLIRMQGER